MHNLLKCRECRYHYRLPYSSVTTIGLWQRVYGVVSGFNSAINDDVFYIRKLRRHYAFITVEWTFRDSIMICSYIAEDKHNKDCPPYFQ